MFRGQVLPFFLYTAILFLLPLSSQELSGQEAASSPESTALARQESYSLIGTVLNAATGEPIAHALVELTVAGSNDNQETRRSPSRPLAVVLEGPQSNWQRSALTDSSGRFLFPSLPPMRVSLKASKPGFFNESQLSGGTPDQSIEIRDGAGEVTVRLTPEAVISGRVMEPNGAPLEGVAIEVQRLELINGQQQLQEAHPSVTTDDEGQFRVADLEPGSYYLSAHPDWQRERNPSRDQFEAAYPIAYYPGVSERAEATPLQLAGGQQAQVDFALHAVPVALLGGVVTGYPSDHEAELRFLNASGDDIALERQYDPQTGRFQARVVATEYCIVKADAEDTRGHNLHAELSMAAGANANNLRLVLAPGLYIPIVLRQLSTKAHSSAPATAAEASSTVPVSVSLHPLDIGHAEVVAQFDGTPPSLVLRDIEPGRYKIEVVPQIPGWYVQSVHYGGVDLTEDELTASPSGLSVMEIALQDDPAALHVAVNARSGKQPAFLLVLPEHGPVGPLMKRANSAGAWEISGLAPGDYKVFAFDRVDGLEYSGPDGLREYLPRATQVRVEAGEKKTIQVELIERGG